MGRETRQTELINFTTAEKEIREKNLDRSQCVGDLGGGFNMNKDNGKPSHSLQVGCVPCLTKTRCSQLMFFKFKDLQWLSTDEMLRCQGIRPNDLRRPRVVPENKFRGMIGNGWEIGTCSRIIIRGLISVGLVANDGKFEDMSTGQCDLDIARWLH